MVNGNVVTPATLYVIYTLAILPYKTVRILWTLIQFLAVFGTLYLLSKNSKFSGPGYLTPAIVILTTFIASNIFLFNIDVGQIYTIYTFFFAFIYYLYTTKSKFNHYLSGIFSGIMVFFRPTVIVFGWGFLLHRNYKSVIGFISGILLGVCIFVLPNKELWGEYFTAMAEYSKIEMLNPTIIPPTCSNEIPSIVEHISNIGDSRGFISLIYPLPSIQGFIHTYFKIVLTSTHTIIAYGLIIIILSFLYIKKKTVSVFSQDRVFLFCFLMYILLEIFMVAPRGGYNAIQWIFPLFIGWKYIVSSRKLLIMAVFSILLLHQFPIGFMFDGHFGEMLLIIITFLLIIRKQTKEDTINYKMLSN